MIKKTASSQLLNILLLSSGLFALSACSSSDNNPPTDPAPVDPTNQDPLGMTEDQTQLAFTFTRASDYGSGRIDRLSLTEGNIVNGSFPATMSDNAIVTDGKKVYQIGRSNIDSVTRFDPLDTSVAEYQISVLGDSSNSTNPQDLVFIDDNKAYLTRRDSDSILIIDPTPASDDTFSFGEIDLGAYDTDFPDATDAIIVDDKLFVLMERLSTGADGFAITDKVGYLAVFDTRTDAEIDTRQSLNDLKGIRLSVTNPTALQYNEAIGSIYVVGRGNYFENPEVTGDFHSGGVEVIDPTNYTHRLLIDDGTDAINQGFFVDAEVVTPELGYLLTYTGFAVTTLRTFNPTTGELSDTPISGLEDIDITTLALGPDGNLWVGINDATPGFIRIDTQTGEIAPERVVTELIPTDVVFMTIDNQ